MHVVRLLWAAAIVVGGGEARGAAPCSTAAACIEAATELQRRYPEAPPAIVARALGFYERACSLGGAKACRKAGMLIRDRAPDPARMKSAFGLGCTLEDATSCNELGMVLVKSEPFKGRQLFQNACRLDSGVGCSNLALAFRDGIGGKVDLAKAEATSDRACKLGHGDACSIQALLVEKRGGKRKVAKRVTRLMVRGCELGSANACTSAGTRYALGVGTPKSTTKAEAFLVRGCDMNFGPACYFLALGRLNKATTRTSRLPSLKLLLRACDLKHVPACERVISEAERDGLSAVSGKSLRMLKRAFCTTTPTAKRCRSGASSSKAPTER